MQIPEPKTTLAELFKEYMFYGRAQLPDGETKLRLEIIRYDPEKKVFVGTGEDDRGLSAIVGEVVPASREFCSVSFRQLFSDSLPIEYGGIIRKTEDDVVMEGTYTPGPTRGVSFAYQFKLSVRTRGEGLFQFGWKDKAMEVEFPKTK